MLGLLLWLALRPGNPQDDVALVDGKLLNARLLELPANRWVRIAPEPSALVRKLPAFLRELAPVPGQDWNRQGHAGLAFDSRRGTLLVFGSDSHNTNWDNSVHEFSPLTLQWTTAYPASPETSYAVNAEGIPVAGSNAAYPWAMHTYDNIEYAPEIDALVVSSRTDHTPPPTEAARKTQRNPTWLYHPDTRQWEILPQADSPSFFANGSAYDPATASVWAYGNGALWRLDLATRHWNRIGGDNKTDLSLHFTMVNDSRRHQFMFFGNYTNSNAVWVYTPSPAPDLGGRWEKRQPSGDPCPRAQAFPVAYDSRQGVFLLVPNENPGRSVTLVYSPDDNRYLRVGGAELPASGMNFMMAYDPNHRVFLLVRGTGDTPVTVWAFRLDMNALASRQGRTSRTPG